MASQSEILSCKGCVNRHRLNCQGGYSLIFSWITGFLALGPKGTDVYKHWNDAITITRDSEGYSIDPTRAMSSDTNDFVHLFLQGAVSITFMQHQKDNDDNRSVIGPIIVKLETAYSVWKHPLVLIMMARALRLDCYNVRSIKKSLRIWQGLQKESLNEIIKYLPKSHVTWNMIRYQRELKWDIKREIANCYSALCRYRKKMRYLKCSLNLHHYLRRNFIESGCASSRGIIWERLQMMITDIRLLLWSGDYQSAYDLAIDVMSICQEKRIKLNFHSAQVCYAVFWKLGKSHHWDRALKQQSRFEDNCKPSEWELLMVQMHRTYLALLGVEQEMPFKELYEDVASRFSGIENSECLNSQGCCRGCCNTTNMYAFLAILGVYYALQYGKMLTEEFKTFEKDSLFHIQQYLQCDERLNKCNEPLCVGLMIHYAFLTQYVHCAKRCYRMAHYLYQFHHEIEPFDPAAYQCHGLLMQNAGKMERAKKYFERARILNIKSKLRLERYQYNECIVLDMRDGCFYCGKKGSGFKRCGRCKVMFYCSRSCQKEHWNYGHREWCVHREFHELKPAHKLLPFFELGTDRVVMKLAS